MKKLLVVLLLIGFSFSACNTENKQGNKAVPNETVAEQRVRPAANGGTSAAYFSYTNTLAEPDTILGVSSSVSAMTQVHESYETEDGMMGMREKTNLSVQPGETVLFEQGGLHIMLMQLGKELSEGDSVSVIMQLAKAGEVEIKLQVKN